MPLVLPARVSAFDARVDAAVERWRGNRVTDRVFYTASAAADHGVLWFVLCAARAGLGDDAARFAAVRAAVAELVQSAVVNLGIKALFRRVRPIYEGLRPHGFRVPRTSSFPSGHASASFCAAVLLAEGTAFGPLLFVLAAVVSFSRIYVKIHHASDVIGGVVIGLAFGVLVRLAVPLP